jgi:hypothetical protein
MSAPYRSPSGCRVGVWKCAVQSQPRSDVDTSELLSGFVVARTQEDLRRADRSPTPRSILSLEDVFERDDEPLVLRRRPDRDAQALG